MERAHAYEIQQNATWGRLLNEPLYGRQFSGPFLGLGCSLLLRLRGRRLDLTGPDGAFRTNACNWNTGFDR